MAATQAVHGPSGWSEAPCQSTTADGWYFPGGTTANSDPLYISLLNPTSTPVVVDLAFMTPTGAVHPINYQGIVLQAGQVQVENVASEVQDVANVSSIVATRTGRVVATEVQGFAGSSGGLALVPGAAHPESRWTIPQSQDAAGASSEIDVFNPGTAPESVTVRLRLGSGPLAPLDRHGGSRRHLGAGHRQADADPPQRNLFGRHRGDGWAGGRRGPDGRAAQHATRHPRPAWRWRWTD